MAFCRNCGMETGSARFCIGCGAPMEAGYVAMDPRQRSMQEMEQMIAYFSIKKHQYAEMLRMGDEIKACEEKGFGIFVAGAVVFGLVALYTVNPYWWLAVAACIVGRMLAKKKNQEKLEKASARRLALVQELSEHYAAYNCPIGFEYTDPHVLEALYKILRQGRASDISQALNLMLQDMHDEKMLYLQQEQTTAAKEAAQNSKTAAGYAGASFWLK